jgi:hypothetical protein
MGSSVGMGIIQSDPKLEGIFDVRESRCQVERLDPIFVQETGD